MTDKIALSFIMLFIEGMANVARFSPADSPFWPSDRREFAFIERTGFELNQRTA